MDEFGGALADDVGAQQPAALERENQLHHPALDAAGSMRPAA
jgi:hypothetical protein